MGKIVRCNLDGQAGKDFGVDHADAWLTARVRIDAASLASWIAGPGSSGLIGMFATGFGITAEWIQVNSSGPQWESASTNTGGVVTADEWHLIEIHVDTGASQADIYVDGTLVITSAPATNQSGSVEINAGYTGQDPSLFYVDDVKVGTFRGAGDIFEDDFESGDFSAWDYSSGDITIIDDPFEIAAWGAEPWGSVDTHSTQEKLVNWDAYGRSFSFVFTDAADDRVRDQQVRVGSEKLLIPAGEWALSEADLDITLLGLRR